MICTKCGRDTADNSVFCPRCLQTMASYPVKPGTVIQLPQRKAEPQKKSASRRRQLSPEEQVLRQKKTIRWLWVTVIMLVLLLGLSVSLLFHIKQEQPSTETIGQNYMTRDTRTR